MDEDELEDEDSDDEPYEWSASGESCAVCDALDGMTFASAPTAAHPKCECEVHRRPANPKPGEDCENDWAITDNSAHWDGHPVRNHLTINVDILIECWNGTTITDSVDVDYGVDPDYDFDNLLDELWDAVSDHAEELIATHCPACTPPPAPDIS